MDDGVPTRWSRRAGRPRRSGRWLAASLGAGAIVATSLWTLGGGSANADDFPAPRRSDLAGMSLPERIVTVAESQVGYRTEPTGSYCNKYSAHWGAGTPDCPGGERAEEWCADFAAWVWQEAGVTVSYGDGPGEINGAAVSFYDWGIAHGEWHPSGRGYVPAPGDVAVYGLSLGGDPSAVHVAIVTGDPPGRRGPDVVNGDGDRTGFSVVEVGTDQLRAGVGQSDSVLAGYVSPPLAPLASPLGET